MVAHEKMRILAESLEPGEKVAEVARRNDVAATVLFSRRRQARLPEEAAPTMMPMLIAEPRPVAAKPRRTPGEGAMPHRDRSRR